MPLLHCCENSRQYSTRDFPRIARTPESTAAIVACDLYHIPSQSSCYHEFLLVHVHTGPTGERLMLIIERVPRNKGTRLISSDGGVARDTITVVQAREHHEYWQRAGQDPICRGTLRWDHPSPRLLDIAFIASAASTTFKYYNLYTRQCYWYSRITLAAMARAFPSCSREGATSFSGGWFSFFGSYKLSQVQLLVDLHTNYCRDLYPPVDRLAPVVPAVEVGRPPSASVTPDILHGLTMFIPNFQRLLVHLTLPEPTAVIPNRHGDQPADGIPGSSGYMESHWVVDDHHGTGGSPRDEAS
ncbi:hypothetical protein EDC04DRAFT_2604138 [Pisolithus marmoratus]|nr:hypothetical protein EDC04DRAFT_2604138 [Pisolithus marmoratus]